MDRARCKWSPPIPTAAAIVTVFAFFFFAFVVGSLFVTHSLREIFTYVTYISLLLEAIGLAIGVAIIIALRWNPSRITTGLYVAFFGSAIWILVAQSLAVNFIVLTFIGKSFALLSDNFEENGGAATPETVHIVNAIVHYIPPIVLFCVAVSHAGTTMVLETHLRMQPASGWLVLKTHAICSATSPIILAVWAMACEYHEVYETKVAYSIPICCVVGIAILVFLLRHSLHESSAMVRAYHSKVVKLS